MTLSPARGVTVSEFERCALLPENLGRGLQLINGEIVEAMPRLAQARMWVRLIDWLLEYLRQNPIGEVFNALRIALVDECHHAVVPDNGVVVRRRAEPAALSDNDPLPLMLVMSDLLIEIQSEGQSGCHLRDLADCDLARGGQLVWLVSPDRKLVKWLTPTDRRLLTRDALDAAISGGDVLPGFDLPLQMLFA